jgi:hypothetical protein
MMSFRALQRIGALAAATLVIVASSNASAARPQRSTTTGDFAQFFASTDVPITCADGLPGTLSTTLSVGGFENVVRDGGRPSGFKTLDVSLFEFDTCVFNFRSSFGTLDGADFDANNRGATARGIVHLFEQSSNGEYRGKFELNVTWATTESPTKNTHYSRDTFGNVTIVNRTEGQFAQATVSGTTNFFAVASFDANNLPVYAAPVNLLANAQNQFANVGQNTNGTVTFTKRDRTDATP